MLEFCIWNSRASEKQEDERIVWYSMSSTYISRTINLSLRHPNTSVSAICISLLSNCLLFHFLSSFLPFPIPHSLILPPADLISAFLFPSSSLHPLSPSTQISFISAFSHIESKNGRRGIQATNNTAWDERKWRITIPGLSLGMNSFMKNTWKWNRSGRWRDNYGGKSQSWSNENKNAWRSHNKLGFLIDWTWSTAWKR